MFETLGKFLASLREKLAEDPAVPAVSDDDTRLLGAILLVHVAAADGRMLPEERTRMRAFLNAAFGLAESEADVILVLADHRDRMGEDMQEVVSMLRRGLDARGRMALIEALWDVAGADGRLHEFEANAIWRITDLLGLSPEDRARLTERFSG
jgi:uncharacterized tellurite resistance protein B-like protein